MVDNIKYDKINPKGDIMQPVRLNNVPGLVFLWQFENLFIAGQPSEESFEGIKALGVSKVYNMRSAQEADFDFEQKACETLGMDYEQFALVENGKLSAEQCKKLSELINDEDKFFIHCGSANRISGWLITYLTQYKNYSFDQATDIAMNSGLTNPAFIEQARDIVESK